MFPETFWNARPLPRPCLTGETVPSGFPSVLPASSWNAPSGMSLQRRSRTIPSGFPSAVREAFGYGRPPERLDRRREEQRARPTLRGRARALRICLAHIQDHHVSMAGPDRALNCDRSPEFRTPRAPPATGSSDLRPCRLASVPKWSPKRGWETGWNGCEGIPGTPRDAGLSQMAPKSRTGNPTERFLWSLSGERAIERSKEFPKPGADSFPDQPSRSARLAQRFPRSGWGGARWRVRVRSGAPRGVGVTALAAADHRARLVARRLTVPRSGG
jgi:hypothetical protein